MLTGRWLFLRQKMQNFFVSLEKLSIYTKKEIRDILLMLWYKGITFAERLEEHVVSACVKKLRVCQYLIRTCMLGHIRSSLFMASMLGLLALCCVAAMPAHVPIRMHLMRREAVLQVVRGAPRNR